jgi:hypothetical protein
VTQISKDWLWSKTDLALGKQLSLFVICRMGEEVVPAAHRARHRANIQETLAFVLLLL